MDYGGIVCDWDNYEGTPVGQYFDIPLPPEEEKVYLETIRPVLLDYCDKALTTFAMGALVYGLVISHPVMPSLSSVKTSSSNTFEKSRTSSITFMSKFQLLLNITMGKRLRPRTLHHDSKPILNTPN